MKKSFFISAMMIFSIYFATAQEFIGKVIFAPSLGFSYMTDKEKAGDNPNDERTALSVSTLFPIGGFVSERFAIGASPGYYFSQSKQVLNFDSQPTTYENKTSLFVINAFCRYYGPIADRFKLLLNSEAGIGFGNQQYTNFQNNSELKKDKTFTYQLGIEPGISFQINEGLFVETTFGRLGYYHSRSKDENATDTSPEDHSSSFSLNFNTFSFGVMFLF
jgi:hypothetical protein